MAGIIEYIYMIVLFLLGCSLASFLIALSWRIHLKMPVKEMLTGRSCCDNCKKNLSWYELIPVISWIILGGKCSKCKNKIPVWYMLGELLLGLLFVLIYYLNLPFSIYFFTAIFFLIVSFDLLFMEIEGYIIHFALICGIVNMVYLIARNWGEQSLWIYLVPILEAGIIGLFFYLVNKIKPAFGEADSYMFFFVALFFPNPFFISKLFFVTIIIAGIFCTFLVAFNKEWLKKHIPLLPFLFISTYVILII